MAINHLKNIHNSLDNSENISSYLLYNLTENILEVDYDVIINSLAIVILEFANNLTEAQRIRLIDKAKNCKKLGFSFIQLVAALV